jgi:hypothetical protein
MSSGMAEAGALAVGKETHGRELERASILGIILCSWKYMYTIYVYI